MEESFSFPDPVPGHLGTFMLTMVHSVVLTSLPDQHSSYGCWCSHCCLASKQLGNKELSPCMVPPGNVLEHHSAGGGHNHPRQPPLLSCLPAHWHQWTVTQPLEMGFVGSICTVCSVTVSSPFLFVLWNHPSTDTPRQKCKNNFILSLHTMDSQ